MNNDSSMAEGKCVVLLFGAARESVGCHRVELKLAMPTTALRLKERLVEQWPALARLVARSRIAVDNQLVRDEHEFGVECEVALIPPVSGG